MLPLSTMNDTENFNPPDDVVHLMGPAAGPELNIAFPLPFHPSMAQPVWAGAQKLKAARDSARRKAVPFDIDGDHLNRLWSAQEGRCFYTGWHLDSAPAGKQEREDRLVVSRPRLWALDCREPLKGYVRGNVVWAALLITVMKAGFSEADFRRAALAVIGQGGSWQPGGPAVSLQTEAAGSPPFEFSPAEHCIPPSPPSVEPVHLPPNISPATGLAIVPDDFVRRLVGLSGPGGGEG